MIPDSGRGIVPPDHEVINFLGLDCPWHYQASVRKWLGTWVERWYTGCMDDTLALWLFVMAFLIGAFL